MVPKYKWLIIVIITVLLLTTSTNSFKQAPAIPVTGFVPPQHENIPTDAIHSLSSFTTNVKNGNHNQITGIYISSKFAYPVSPQPAGQPGFVSSSPDTITQFSMASNYGSTGLLAHNYLAGSDFSNLIMGDLIILVYGDGHLKRYQVNSIQKYQALDPVNPYSSFVDLQGSQTINVTDLFNNIYNFPGRLILQTCISAYDNPSWGRLFILAEPIPVYGFSSLKNKITNYIFQARGNSSFLRN